MNVGQSNAALRLRRWLNGDTSLDNRAPDDLHELTKGAAKRLGVAVDADLTDDAILAIRRLREDAQRPRPHHHEALHFLWGFIHGLAGHHGDSATCDEAGCSHARAALERTDG